MKRDAVGLIATHATTDAPAVAENEKQVSLRLPSSVIERAKRLGNVLEGRLPGAGVKPAGVLRAALLRGLAELERENGIAGSDAPNGEPRR